MISVIFAVALREGQGFGNPCFDDDCPVNMMPVLPINEEECRVTEQYLDCFETTTLCQGQQEVIERAREVIETAYKANCGGSTSGSGANDFRHVLATVAA